MRRLLPALLTSAVLLSASACGRGDYSSAVEADPPGLSIEEKARLRQRQIRRGDPFITTDDGIMWFRKVGELVQKLQ